MAYGGLFKNPVQVLATPCIRKKQSAPNLRSTMELFPAVLLALATLATLAIFKFAFSLNYL